MLAQLLGLGPGLGGPTAGGAGLGGLELDSFTELRVPELASLGMGGDAAAAAAAAERRHALNMLDWGFPTAADPARHAALAAEGVPAGRMEHASLRVSAAARFNCRLPALLAAGCCLASCARDTHSFQCFPRGRENGSAGCTDLACPACFCLPCMPERLLLHALGLAAETKACCSSSQWLHQKL